MSRVHQPAAASRQAQQGVVLIIGLIFLLIMTILGVTAIQSSTMQERMAGNLGDRSMVFQAAENALQQGEDFVVTSSCAAIASRLANVPNPDVGSWGSAAQLVDGNFSSAYMIKRMPWVRHDESAPAENPDLCPGFYYITARAESDKGMMVVLQSTVLKRF